MLLLRLVYEARLTHSADHRKPPKLIASKAKRLVGGHGRIYVFLNTVFPL